MDELRNFLNSTREHIFSVPNDNQVQRDPCFVQARSFDRGQTEAAMSYAYLLHLLLQWTESYLPEVGRGLAGQLVNVNNQCASFIRFPFASGSSAELFDPDNRPKLQSLMSKILALCSDVVAFTLLSAGACGPGDLVRLRLLCRREHARRRSVAESAPRQNG